VPQGPSEIAPVLLAQGNNTGSPQAGQLGPTTTAPTTGPGTNGVDNGTTTDNGVNNGTTMGNGTAGAGSNPYAPGSNSASRSEYPAGTDNGHTGAGLWGLLGLIGLIGLFRSHRASRETYHGEPRVQR
jgi:hypothetical protein